MASCYFYCAELQYSRSASTLPLDRQAGKDDAKDGGFLSLWEWMQVMVVWKLEQSCWRMLTLGKDAEDYSWFIHDYFSVHHLCCLSNCSHRPKLIIFFYSNMSLLRKGSKATLRPVLEDFQSALDHKNAIIATLQTQREALASTQDRYDRVKDDLLRAKARLEGLMRDHETRVSNNQERLELTVRNVQELRSQAEMLGQELKVRMGALREAKFSVQQWAEIVERKEEEANEARLRGQEQTNLEEVRGMEQERTRLQVSQVRQEVQRGKRENGLLRDHLNELSERTHKTQSYIRSLMRQESNLTETLSQLQDQNAGLDASISQLDTAISINQGTIANKEKDCQEWQFHIASKELQKKKIENEIREKVKQLSAEKERWRTLCGQLEQAKAEVSRFDSLIGDSSAEINFIISKNNEIKAVNEQLNDDLTVCHRHLDNLTRVNRSLDEEVSSLHATNLKAIAKLRQPFASRTNGECPVGEKWSGEKWGAASRATNFETGEFESWRNA